MKECSVKLPSEIYIMHDHYQIQLETVIHTLVGTFSFYHEDHLKRSIKRKYERRSIEFARDLFLKE